MDAAPKHTKANQHINTHIMATHKSQFYEKTVYIVTVQQIICVRSERMLTCKIYCEQNALLHS